MLARLRTARDFLYEKLNTIPGIAVPKPKGAMYLFSRIDSMDALVSLAKSAMPAKPGTTATCTQISNTVQQILILPDVSISSQLKTKLKG